MESSVFLGKDERVYQMKYIPKNANIIYTYCRYGCREPIYG